MENVDSYVDRKYKDMRYLLQLKENKTLAVAHLFSMQYGKYTDDVTRVKYFDSRAAAKQYKEKYDKQNKTKIVSLVEFLKDQNILTEI
jgi:hypothetical protein